MKKLTKKGQVDALMPLITAMVVIGIVLVVGFLIFAQVGSQVWTIDGLSEASNDTSYGYNATMAVTEAINDIPGWLPIIIVVVIGALLIGLVSFLRGQAR